MHVERIEKSRQGERRGATYLRQVRSACARGFQVRSPWLVLVGLIVAIVLGFLYFTLRSPDPVERGFPSYMQNADR